PTGFAQKVFAGTVAASPPRCAAGQCLAVKTTLNAAASLLVRALPQGFWTKGRTRGAAPMKERPFRRGKAAPHITAAKPLRTDFLCKAPRGCDLATIEANGKWNHQR